MSKGDREAPGSPVSLDPKAVWGITFSSQGMKIHKAWNQPPSYMGRDFENKLFPLILPDEMRNWEISDP